MVPHLFLDIKAVIQSQKKVRTGVTELSQNRLYLRLDFYLFEELKYKTKPKSRRVQD